MDQRLAKRWLVDSTVARRPARRWLIDWTVDQRPAIVNADSLKVTNGQEFETDDSL